MPVKKPFRIRKMPDIDAFMRTMREHNLDIPVSHNLTALRQPLQLGPVRLSNRLAVNPMEGGDAENNGAPGELTYRRYAYLASGGAGLLWFEACAFTEEGRGGPNQLYLNTGSVADFARLTGLVDESCRRRHGYTPYKVLQLSHAGRYCRDDHGLARPLTVFKNPYMDEFSPGLQVVSDEYLQDLEDKLVEAAGLAQQAGFDAIDLKMCHDFLLREILAAHTRPGPYGGSFENRTRFFFNVIDKIQARVGTKLDIAVRLNAYDSIPYPYGWGMRPEEGVMHEDLSEPIRLVRLLLTKGIRLFGISTMFPHFAPRGRGYLANFDPAAQISPYPGVEILLQATRRIKRLVPEAILVPAGLSWFEQFAAQVAAGGVEQGWFDIAGFGRQALANSSFLQDILCGHKADHQKSCRSCDLCLKCLFMGWPSGCVHNDQLYKAIFKIASSS